MSYLTAEEILDATDVDVAEVEVPEWGGMVLVRGLDAHYVNSLFERGFIAMVPGSDEGAIDISKLDFVDLAARSLVGEDGKRLLTRNQMKKMGEKSFAPISRIAQKALELSGLSAEEEADGDSKAKNE